MTQPNITLSEIRDELLEQHASLRTLAGDVRAAIERSAGADASRLSERIGALATALAAHNQREAELLGEVIPSVDAWGEVRAARMDELHLKEHHDLHKALQDATTDDPAQAQAVLSIIDRLLSHMQEEEKTFLNDTVLRDDVISVGQSGG